MDVLNDNVCPFFVPMRQSLKQQLAARAVEAGTSMRGYVMMALRAQGLDVRDHEIMDRRRREWRDAADVPQQAAE